MTNETMPPNVAFLDRAVVDHYISDAHIGLHDFETRFLEELHLCRTDRTRKILAVGCGAGREVFALAKQGNDVLGIDLSPEMIFAAKTLAANYELSAEFSVAQLPPIPALDRSFHMVLGTYNFYGHLPTRVERRRFLTEATRILIPGGDLILTFHETDIGRKSLTTTEPHCVSMNVLPGGQGPAIVMKTFAVEEFQSELRDCGYQVMHRRKIVDLSKALTLPWSRSVWMVHARHLI